MTDVERFVLLLSALMAADCGLTLLAVEYLPLCEMCGGLAVFLATKAVVSAACLVGLFRLVRCHHEPKKI